MTIATASRIAVPIAHIYQTNAWVFAQSLEGLSETELRFQPIATCNPMIWIAGHMAQVRTLVLKLMGEPVETGWGEPFGRGSKLGDPSQYPSIGEIKETMTTLGERLGAKLLSLDDETLLRPASGPNLPNSETLVDQIAFLALHESYHAGQMGYLRKALGYEGPVG